tara:strand:+ start:540 stop:1226 length:687 start_codon:yes stop_codon:yes gene_type:complete
MSTIFQTKNNKIQKIGNNKYKFSFENGEKFNNFYKKSWKFLKLKNIKQKNFTFKADNVMPLSKFISQNHNTLTYNQAKWLFLDIGKQYEGLEKDGYGNLYIDIKDIVCIFLNDIDDRNGEKIIYLYLNTSSFVGKKNMDMELTKPIKRNKYFSPEMLSLNSFPAMLPYTSCYYSLALLIIDILSDLKNLDHTTENFELLLQEYADTKLYYSLIRCLDEDPNNRYFLFI